MGGPEPRFYPAGYNGKNHRPLSGGLPETVSATGLRAIPIRQSRTRYTHGLVRFSLQPLLAAKDYTAALSKLAALRAPIDAFFDNVMVMADDAELKANRLRLLAQLRDLFTSVADISVLQH